MAQYQVTWGTISKAVEANSDADAWAAFCDKTPEAWKYPNKHESVVVQAASVDPVEVVPVVAEAAVDADDEDWTPLEDTVS